MLRECGHEVLVANARKTRLIYANKRKTDEIDAENLARLARLDPKLLCPVEHRVALRRFTAVRSPRRAPSDAGPRRGHRRGRWIRRSPLVIARRKACRR